MAQPLDFSRPLPFDLPTALDREKPALIVGCGAVALGFHFARIQALIRTPQLYLCEVDPLRFEYVEKRWKSNPRVSPVREIPAQTAFSLVLIATPPKFHYEYYEQIAERTDALLIEKPLTISVNEAEAIDFSSREKKVMVFVNLLRRLLINYRLLRDIYRSKRFGELRSVRLSEGGVFNWDAASMGSFSRELNGGGVLMDTGPHALDLLFQVFDTLELESSLMDSWGKERSIEANCYCK